MNYESTSHFAKRTTDTSQTPTLFYECSKKTTIWPLQILYIYYIFIAAFCNYVGQYIFTYFTCKFVIIFIHHCWQYIEKTNKKETP